MDIYDYFDAICSEVKYKSVHKELKNELRSHIEDSAAERIKQGMSYSAAISEAVGRMGNPKEIGKTFDRLYRMPFNSKWGFIIWGALVTIIIYLGYPLIYKLGDGTIGILRFNNIFIGIILFAFFLINMLFLKRGTKIITLRDMAQIALGYFIGWFITVPALIHIANLYTPMHYAWVSDVPLPVAAPYLPLLPKNFSVFGVEYFALWFPLMTYMLSATSRKKFKLTFPLYTFRLYDGKMLEDFNAYADGVDENGNKITNAFLPMFGLERDKYGERKKHIDSEDREMY